MPALAPELNKFLLALAPHAESAARICQAIAVGKFSGRMQLREICLASGIASARSSAVEMALNAGVEVGLIKKIGALEWQPLPMQAHFKHIAIALEGIAMYLEQIHADKTEVDVVLTLPEKPSQLESALLERGHVGSVVEFTDAIFAHIASMATEKFVVMMPFIDETGMANLMDAWERAREGVECILITRHNAENSVKTITENQAKLNGMGVKIFSYWLQKGAKYETFHAKVLLADRNLAYVGSANATKASLELSMELGVMLKGKSAKTVSEIADAILQIARPV